MDRCKLKIRTPLSKIIKSELSMSQKWFVFAILIFSVLGFIIPSSVFAQSTYIINIPTGAADPAAPYFWQSEKDGITTGDIQIVIGDTVSWENADTAAHTVTSGTPETGPDEIFDSGLYAPGKSFSYTFNEVGEYPYFCLVHPWMIGNVVVVTGLQVLPNVGADAGDGTTTFDVEYQFNRVVSDGRIDEEQKAITFSLIGSAKSDNHDLTLLLPKNLINDPYVIWADGQQITDYEIDSQGGINTVVLPLTEQTEQVTIVGTSVVPEFQEIALMVLGSSIVFVIIFARKFSRFSKI